MPRYRHGILWPRRVGRAALAGDNAEEREAALSEGQAILDKGCLGHNFYWFHRDAMATYLQAQDWDAVERHAGALANFMVEDPLPYAAFYIERARAMAALGSNRNDAAARAELDRLRGYAEKTYLRTAQTGIDRMIQGT